MQQFFVYADYKATTNEIFYIGKGTELRVKKKQRENIIWRRIHAKHGSYRRILSDGLQEWAAHELECNLIALYGRKDLGLGPLVNLTDGGDGHTGMSADAKTVMSEKKTKHKYLLNGKQMTLNQISSEYGIKRVTLTKRLYDGWSIKDAVGKKLLKGCQPSRMVFVNGEEIPLLAISETMGIKSSTLRRRLDCGMSLIDALSTPIRQSTRWHNKERQPNA